MDDYYDLGSYSRPVTTSSPEAQVWCDRGLRWYYGFNLEESVRCYRLAAELDPRCAMAHWGIASASGAYYNRKWEDFTAAELPETLATTRRATEAALSCVDRATPVEQALIRALARRYPSDQATSIDELLAWNDAYAAAMRDAYTAFPEDLDVSALFTEAMLNRTPWQLWDLRSGEPALGADTLEAVAVLEEAMQLVERRGDAPHPGVLHFYIHVMEMSPHPERALRASDALRDLMPEAGHLLHMPSHIDILCGDYYAGLVANDRAIRADRKYLEREGAYNGYTFYRI